MAGARRFRLESGSIAVASDELDKIISKIEITEAINELKNGKSPGIDQITAELLKKCLINESFIELLHTLFNKFFDESIFPSSWAEGIIIPIFKKGKHTDPNNYRGITLLSILGKVFTIILNKCLTKWSESNKIISENQAGFRKGYQTFDHIFTLQTLAKQYINKKQKLFVCFVDFKKAYDLVWRNGLLHKLLKYGISSKMKNMISSIYSNVKSYVKVNGTLSKSFGCSLGLCQGCVLSPILFSLFINDLGEDMRSLNTMGCKLYDTVIHTLLYADNLIIFANSKEELQMKIDKLSDFFSKWELVVGLPKTKIMIFGGGYNVAKKNSFYFRGSCVEIVK